MKKKKRTFFIIGGIVLLLLLMVIFKGKGGDKEVKVNTANATLETLTETVDANGKIQPEVEVVMGSDVSGEIVQLKYKEGDQVKKGDTLILINPDIYESALNRAEATLNNARANAANSRARLAQAKAQFSLSKKTFNRNKRLFDQGAISQADFETAESNYEVAEAELIASQETVNGSEFSVMSANASRNEALDNLNRTIIVAPMDGTISRLNKEEGEQVQGSMGVSVTDILTVANLDNMEVQVDVNENDIVRVSMGDTAMIEVDAFLDHKFKGIVTEIANSANTTGMNVDQVTNFSVKVRILRSSYQDLIPEDKPYLSPFRPGMSATVEIQTETERNVVVVPVAAVTTREDTVRTERKGRPGAKRTDEEAEPFECVFIYSEGKAKLVLVDAGIQNSKFIHIKSGIKEGDEVIVGPYDAVSRKLMHNDKVQKVSKGEMFGNVEVTVGN